MQCTSPPAAPLLPSFAPLFKPNLTFPIVGCTCYALHQPPALLNQLLTNQKYHGTLFFGRPDAQFRKPAIGRPINELRGTGCAGRRGFPWEGPKQPSSPRPSPALTPVAAQHPNPTRVTSPRPRVPSHPRDSEPKSNFVPIFVQSPRPHKPKRVASQRSFFTVAPAHH